MRHQNEGGAISIIAQCHSLCAGSALSSELVMSVVVDWEPSFRYKLSSLSSLWLFLYLISCCTHYNCNHWCSITSWLWAVTASRSLIILSEWSVSICLLLSSVTSEVEISAAYRVNWLVKGSLWAWLLTVLLTWWDQGFDVIVSYASDVTVRLKVLSDQYMRG